MTNVFIISAPSGSGKSTLLGRILEADARLAEPRLVFSVSYTTRKPRGKERHGQEYYFVSTAEFEAQIERGEYLEWAKVFEHYYGTHRRFWDEATRTGRDLVLDIDVQGARQLRRRFPEAVSIFILPPSREVLEERLQTRSEDSGDVIERRLAGAAKEIGSYHEYDYIIVNHDLEEAASDLAAIFRAERRRRQRKEDEIRPILASFLQAGDRQ